VIPSHLDFRVLKTKISIEQVLADKGLLARLRRRGDSWVGACPLHGGDNPNAFVVHRGRNIWRCFTGCNAGGDIVALVRRLGHTSYSEAARYLAGIVGTFPPVEHTPVSRAVSRCFRPFVRQLPLEPDVPFLRRKAILPETARRFEAGAFHGRGMLSGCVAVRVHDPAGRPLGYAGRRLDPLQAAHRGKWVFPPGLPRNTLLYGYHHASAHQRPIVVVECPWGVMRVAQLRLPAVALLGTYLSAQQRALLNELPGVILMLDGDDAGRTAAVAIRQKLNAVAVVELPYGLDPDDLTDNTLLKLLSL
jgi:DNA primase